MRFSSGGGVVAAVAVALGAGWLLSLKTTQVANWFVMTDELYYERLAISVAQTGSLLPRLQGELIGNVNQLYPAVLSLVYGKGEVPVSLAAAHRLNAFLMASAVIPVYLLARRAGVGRLLSVWAGALCVAVPWLVLSSFLLTEVVAYPAFCWSLLALAYATQRKSTLADVVALASIALAVLARVQFAVLLAVLAAAVAAEALLAASAAGRRGRSLIRHAAADVLRTRKVLVGVYAALVLAAVAAAAVGEASSLLGSYAVTADAIRVDLGLARLGLEHVGVLALGLALVPFLLGTAWLVDRLRPAAAPAERAVACVGCATLVLLTLQVASFNQRFGAGLVKDRYLFYAVPVVLVALAAAVSSREWPRWPALVGVAAFCAAGVALLPLPTYEKLNVDSPVAILNDEILRLATSLGWARLLLVLATAVSLQLLLLGAFLSRRSVAAAVAVLATVALPLQTWYAFDRLFAVPGTNGLPIDLDQGVVYSWIDRAIGGSSRVSMIRYPENPSDYWAGVQYWWDVEFWNESVVREAFVPEPGRADSWTTQFDPRTGRALAAVETPYLLVHQTDVRFRIAGAQVEFDRGSYLVEAGRPWRAEYVTYDIYGDGWTRPHTPAEVRVFAQPGQRTPQKRFLTLAIRAPETEVEPVRPVTVATNLVRLEQGVAPETSWEPQVTVCVPPGGYGSVLVETPHVSAVYRDPTLAPLTGEVDRPAGVLLRWLALADEAEPLERCPPS